MRNITPFTCCPASRNVRGVNGAVLDWLYGVDEAQATGAQLDARIREFNQKLKEQGKISQAQLDAANANLARQGADTYSKQVDAAFDEGWDEGLSAMTGASSGFLNGAAKAVWDAVPWWGWAIGAGYIAYRLGLWDVAKHQIKTKYAT